MDIAINGGHIALPTRIHASTSDSTKKVMQMCWHQQHRGCYTISQYTTYSKFAGMRPLECAGRSLIERELTPRSP